MKHYIYHFFVLVLLMCIACNEHETIAPPPEEHGSLQDIEVVVPDTTSVLTIDAALKVASNLLRSDNSRSAERKVSTVEAILNVSGDTSAYIVNYDDNKGYVILSASKSYYPIIAESEYGNLSVERFSGNHPLLEWLDKETSNITASAQLSDDLKKTINSLWTSCSYDKKKVFSNSRGEVPDKPDVYYDSLRRWTLDPNVEVYLYNDYIHTYEYSNLDQQTKDHITGALHYAGNANYGSIESSTIVLRREVHTNVRTQLLKTQWHQNWPFNLRVPGDEPLGCGTIAAGQIMKFHKFPSSIDWDNMPDQWASRTTQDFLYALANNLGVDFDRPSTTIDKAKSCLTEYGYSVIKKSHNLNEVATEVSRGFPVYMRGTDKSYKDGGHSWVCDGVWRSNSDVVLSFMTIDYRPTIYSPPDLMVEAYKHVYNNGYVPTHLHYNWGWGGDGDGYYLDSNMQVTTKSGEQYCFKHNRNNLFIRPQ